jgi:hypothetical protein
VRSVELVAHGQDDEIDREHYVYTLLYHDRR